MSGGKIFRKPNGVVTYYDQIEIGSYSFDATITVQDKRGDPLALHCGRIVGFDMKYGDEAVAYYELGQWYVTPDAFLPSWDEFTESACLARDLLIQKWSNPEKIKAKTVTTDLF